MNLRDERYLLFEGSGAISSWGLELPQVFQQFDYNTISDVILQIRYTARESGGLLKQQAVTELQSALNAIALDENQKGLARLVSLRHEFPSEWYRFLHPAGATDTQSLTFALTPERFPFLSQGRHITLGKFEVFVQVDSAFAGTHNVRRECRRGRTDAEDDADLPLIYLDPFDQGTNKLALRKSCPPLEPLTLVARTRSIIAVLRRIS